MAGIIKIASKYTSMMMPAKHRISLSGKWNISDGPTMDKPIVMTVKLITN
jgi:hypothetical protein